MGNNVSYKVVRIGLIRIKMYDGIVRTLTDVRYAPELRKNLIFLGMLDSNDCTYKAECGLLKVLKSTLVVMKGLKKNDIYLLQGSTVTGAIAISTSYLDSDIIRLWHMRLGHISERSITVLNKHNLLSGQNTRNWTFMNIVFLGSSVGLHSIRLFTEPRVSWIISIQIFRVPLVFLL